MASAVTWDDYYGHIRRCHRCVKRGECGAARKMLAKLQETKRKGTAMSDNDDDRKISEAVGIIERQYLDAVNSYADDLAQRCESGDIQDYEDLDTAIHETVGGSLWVIYTFQAKLVMLVSRNEDEADEQGLGCDTVERRAFWAMCADLVEALKRKLPTSDIGNPWRCESCDSDHDSFEGAKECCATEVVGEDSDGA
jgi:hypothetical protein